MIIVSSFLLVVAHFTSAYIPMCPVGQTCYGEVGPLILIGIAYSIYAAALWTSIPYVVEAKTIGTAFGFCTAI